MPNARHAPRQLVHRGVVEAAAILVDEALTGPREARRRVVDAWSPGAVVHRLGSALLLRFAAPRPVDCARAPGLPLVRTAADPCAPLASAPLAPDELAAVAAPPGAVVLVRGGAVTAVVPAGADREDPASWIDLAAFEVVRAESLGAAPGAPTIVAAQTNVAPRHLLGVPAAPAEQAAVAAAVAAIAAGRRPPAAARAAAEAGGGGALSFFATFAATIASLLGRLFAASASAPARSGSSSRDRRALAAQPAAPAGPSLRDRLEARMRTWIAELLVRSRLAHLVGRRQAEYVGRLLDMIDRGDLDEALRHAIPLGGDAEGAAAPALGVPTPRSDLTISLAASGPGSAMVAATDLHAHLRAKYRMIFERLERDGRIDEAAFVLAELLHDEQEAVAFLERHGRLRLAAELAEARRLPPALVVRQWFLAGDVARAVRIARRHGAFADALVRMGQHERAPELRVLWAETLAEAGDFAAAVEVIWPVESARHIGAAWIDRAIAQGGASGARMLVKKLALVPASFADVRDRALALLAGDGHQAAHERRAFAEALTAVGTSPEARTLARPTLRALVGDGARSADPRTQQIASRLFTFADDGALRADMPAWATALRTPLAQITPPRAYTVAATDAGTMPILDAAYLPNGRVVGALGEAGVRVLGREGKALFHLDQPAHTLVISDRGDRAIALARRGDAVRLARLDLVRRRSEPWCEAPTVVGALDFDGAQWVAASTGKLFAIDALDPRFAALESLDLGESPFIEAIARSPTSCALVTTGADPLVRCRYELPSWTLRMRTPLSLKRDAGQAQDATTAVSADGAVAITTSSAQGGMSVVHASATDTVRELRIATDGPWRSCGIRLRDGWLACAVGYRDRVEVHLLDEAHLIQRAQITLGGAKKASVRIGNDTLTVADDRGRVLVVELSHGGLIHDLRVR